jgi:hypothetical protein
MKQLDGICALAFSLLLASCGERNAPPLNTKSGEPSVFHFATNGASFESLKQKLGEPLIRLDMGDGTTFVHFDSSMFPGTPSNISGLSAFIMNGRASNIRFGYAEGPYSGAPVMQITNGIPRFVFRFSTADEDPISVTPATIAPLEMKTNQAGTVFVEKLLVELQPDDIAMFRDMTAAKVGQDVQVAIGPKVVVTFKAHAPISNGRLELQKLGFRLPLEELLPKGP